MEKLNRRIEALEATMIPKEEWRIIIVWPGENESEKIARDREATGYNGQYTKYIIIEGVAPPHREAEHGHL